MKTYRLTSMISKYFHRPITVRVRTAVWVRFCGTSVNEMVVPMIAVVLPGIGVDRTPVADDCTP